MNGPVLDLPLVAIGSCRGDPNNVDVAAATTARASPCCGRPGRNADAVAEITVALLFAVNRGVVPADRDVREGEVYRDGTIPYQRFRAWQLAGPHRRASSASARSAARRSGASRGSACSVIAYDPYAADATHSLDDLLAESDVVSMHAAGHARDRRA